MLKDLLKHSALLKDIPDEILDAMADKMSQMTFSPGEIVFTQGAPSDAFYYVIAGQAEIMEEGEDKKSQITYAGPGEFLGEKTVLAHKPRTATVKATADLRMARLDKVDLEMLALVQPDLETVLGQAESKPNIAVILRHLPLFADLPADVLRAVSRKMTVEMFEKGEVVFRQGDEGDKLYLILSGQVKILVDDGEYERVVSYLGQDSFFGEMALISEGPRTASVEVSVDARLLSLDKEDFLQLLDMYPTIALTMSRYAVKRVQGLEQLTEVRDYQIIAVVGGNGESLARRLAHYIEGRVILYRLPGVAAVSEQTLLEDIFISDAPETIDARELVEILSILISGFDKVLLLLPFIMNRLTVKALGLANVTTVIDMDVAPWIKVSSDGEVWGAQDDPKSIDLLARRILHRVVGLALSSGSGRSIAHVGVLQVLEEAGVPIDLIAGTSGGALFGGLYAAGLGLKAIEDFALNLHEIARFKLFGGLADYNFFNLTHGIIKGNKVVEFLDDVIGHKNFSDLAIPTYMVAADVITGEEVVLDNGSVALAMRASFSIEGVFVPAEIDGRYLMDGAAVNPVPCSVLAERGADIIIASSVIPALEERVQRKALKESKQIPNIINVMLGKSEVMESEIVKTKMTPVDVVIKPAVGMYPATAFDKADDFMRFGRAAARLEIEHIIF